MGGPIRIPPDLINRDYQTAGPIRIPPDLINRDYQTAGQIAHCFRDEIIDHNKKMRDRIPSTVTHLAFGGNHRCHLTHCVPETVKHLEFPFGYSDDLSNTNSSWCDTCNTWIYV